ncbi:sensor histidine kinase [Marinobacter sp. NP-4(2019)]|uniref:sensor histidine kinase n=1 Tax=Marinobacter sp. NP-4(2019) TaxID=2488665 RepID=UPI000FC3CBED|nr:sensor histidine kinase [Marinobacter sp. NP-4(2019)]AZT84843.1 sensor histidine kinase [Marinobacter sp. NP-4(2019)]
MESETSGLHRFVALARRLFFASSTSGGGTAEAVLSDVARRVTLGVLVFAALLFALLIFLIITFAHRSIEQELTRNNASMVGLVQQVVGEYFSSFADMGRLVSQRPDLIDAVRERDVERVRAHLRALVASHPDNSRAFIADAGGVLRYDYPVDASVLGQDFSYRDWYRGVSEDQRPYLSLIYQRAALDAPYVVALATPIRSDGEILGYLVYQRTVQGLAAWISRYSPQPGAIRMIDRQGTAAQIQADKPADLWADHELARRALAGNTGTGHGMDPQSGEESLISYGPVEPFGWAVVVSRPWNAVFGTARDLAWHIVGFALLALLIMGVMGYFWLRTLMQYQRSLEGRNEAVNDYAERLHAANQELESFTYSVSHDLRSPLRAMNGFSRILAEEYREELPEKARRYIGLVRENAVQMGQLVDDLLAFSRLGRHSLKIQSVDPNPIVSEVLEEIVTEEDRNSEIQRQDLDACRADASLLRQVFSNLISNALKYSRKSEQPKITIGCETQGDEVIYYVMDNGVGFDMTYAHKLFGVFQRLHRAEDFPGTGVGLAIVHRIVDRHGGRIWAEAKPDEGATFFFTLGRSQ